MRYGGLIVSGVNNVIYIQRLFKFDKLREDRII